MKGVTFDLKFLWFVFTDMGILSYEQRLSESQSSQHATSKALLTFYEWGLGGIKKKTPVSQQHSLESVSNM